MLSLVGSLLGLFGLLTSCQCETTTQPNQAPILTNHAFSVSEFIVDTQEIGQVVGTDPDEDTLNYSITVNDNDLFEIVASNGSLSLADGKSLNHDTATQHVITVNASDGPLSAAAFVTINVLDTNFAPQSSNHLFTVSEIIDDAEVIGTVLATDPEGRDLSYSLVNNDLFEIRLDNGALSLVDGRSLDYDMTNRHSLQVGISDGDMSIQVTVTVVVLENQAPVIANQGGNFEVLQTIDDAHVIGTVMATDPENQPLTYSITANSSGLFEIGSANGEISLVTGSNFSGVGEHTLTVRVFDGDKASTATVTINVISILGYNYQSLDLLAISDSGVADDDNHTSNENLSFSVMLERVVDNGITIRTNDYALQNSEKLYFQFSNTVDNSVTNYIATVVGGNYDISGVAEANYDPFEVSLFISNTGDDSVTTLSGMPLTVRVDRTVNGYLTGRNLNTNLFIMEEVIFPPTEKGITFSNTNGNTLVVGDIIAFTFHFIEPINVTENINSAWDVHKTNIFSIANVIALPNYRYLDNNFSLMCFVEVFSGIGLTSLRLAGIHVDNAGNSAILDKHPINEALGSVIFNIILPSSITYP